MNNRKKGAVSTVESGKWKEERKSVKYSSKWKVVSGKEEQR